MYLKEAYINREAWLEIWRHAKDGGTLEVGGLLIGMRCKLANSSLTWITNSVRGDCVSSSTKVDIAPSTYNKLPKGIDKEELAIVGWYHTHPGLGIFLSARDRCTMKWLFNDPYSIAFVLDNLGKDYGFFGWDYSVQNTGRLNVYLFNGSNHKYYVEDL